MRLGAYPRREELKGALLNKASTLTHKYYRLQRLAKDKNALAYLASPSLTQKKSFTALTPCVHIKKLF
jgi:hypothetical protein